MKENIFLEKIKTGCSFLIAEGYEFINFEGNITYKKELSEEGFSINFRYYESEDSIGNYFRVDSFGALKRFNEIEIEIQKIIGLNLEDYYTIYTKPTWNYIPDKAEHRVFKDQIEFLIRNENDLDLFFDFLKSFYLKTVVNFFLEYESIKAVNIKLQELLETKKIQSLLTDSGTNTAIIRYYTIGIISNNKFVYDFFENIYFPYLLDQHENELEKRELNILEKLKKNLK